MIAKEVKIVPLGRSSNVNESVSSFGEIKNFKDCDVVYGPDGTRYEPRFICSVVEDAINTINIINEGVIKDFLASLPFVYTFSVRTMATDGKHIFMNPGFIMQLLDWCDGSCIGVAFVIIHEVYHNLFKHAMREAADPARFTDHTRCNYAQDYEINWVIEHSYPDKRTEQEAQDEGESVLDENGERVQLFKGITETCKGLIDEKFRNTLWEDIYDQLDGSEGEQQEDEESEVTEIDFSDEYKDGFKQGVEDAIRTLRAQGLVESVVMSDKLLLLTCMLNEGKVTMQGTYDDGYNEGYNRVMETIKNLLNGGGGSQGGQGGGQPGGNQKEVEIPGLPSIKPKFNIPPGASQQQQGGGKNMPKIEMPNQSQDSQQGQGQSGQGQSGDQGDGQGQSGQGQGQDGQGQGQQGQGQSGQGQNGQGQGQGQQGQSGGQSGQGQGGGQGGDEGGFDQTQGGHVGTGSSKIPKPKAGSNSGSGNGSGNGSGDGKMSTEDAQSIMDNMPMQGAKGSKDKAQVIGIADKGYSGKGGAQGNHVISQDDGRKLANEAGFDDGSDSDTYMGKEDPFNDKNAVRKALAGLKKSSTVLGSSGTPGCGMFDNIEGLLVSLFSPTVNWKKMLERYMKGFQSQLMDMGYSKKGVIYGRYNRFKDYEGETAQRILICIDTSGSVIYSGDYLQHIVADTAEITCKLGIHYVNVIQFSDGVYRDTEFKKKNVPPASEFAIKADKSGGTSFMPVFDYIHENYTKKRKNFQAVIFFTDDDVYSCRLPKISEIKKFANHIIWVVLSRELKKLPYGKVIAIGPDDFKGQLSNYETIDNSEYDEIEETNESFNRNCMNKRIYTMNEAVFGNHKLAGQKRAAEKAAAAAAAAAAQADGAETSDAAPSRSAEPVPAPKKKTLSVMDKRKLALDALNATGATTGALAAAKIDLYNRLKPWVTKFFAGFDFFKDEESVDSYTRRSGKYMYINNYNTIDVVGDIRLVGPTILENLPDGFVLERVTGNVDVGMCSTLTRLPKCLPMSVSGDFRITNMRRLENLDGCPIYVDKNVIVTACPNLQSVFGAPKRCGYFYSDKFTQEDYLEYIADKYGIKESMKLRASLRNKMNEAFKSNKLSELANNPANKDALQAFRRINVLWSEIPDEIINPIYNNVARSLAKRRDDNQSGEYGIYIWCDSSNKINIIGTGNNVKEWGQGKSWLYLDPTVIRTVNDRISMVRRACRGSQTDIDDCVSLNVKYDNKNVSAICQRGSIDTRELTYTHLLLIPDLCSKAYLIQGTKDPRSSASDNKIAHFSYKNSTRDREQMQQSRAKAIAGIIVQGRNLNPNDPAYQKYYEKFFVTDDKLIKKFILVKNIFDYRAIINSMIESMTNNANMVRNALFKYKENGSIDDEIFDGLYASYTSTFIRKFRQSAKEMLDAIDTIINDKKYKDADFATVLQALSNTFELMYSAENPTTYWGLRGRNSDLWSNSYPYREMTEWIKIYSETIQKFAEIMSTLDHIRKGDVDFVRTYAESYLR